MDKKIREPIQARSIDKKNKIIETAYDVFSKVGYYNANTAEIAKKAGVSTGIVYGYFKDKRDILSYVIDIYINKVASPCMDYVTKLKTPVDLKKAISELLDLITKTHKQNANLHNILHSLTASDKDIHKKFISLEDHITLSLADTLKNLGLNIPNTHEKVHIAMNLMQSFSHEFVYDRHEYIDYEQMRTVTIQMIYDLFN